LPGVCSPKTGLTDLQSAALIREVHVYGQSLQLGAEQNGAAQHIGLGSKLMAHAEQLAHANGYRRMAVIAAVGTRGYYRRLEYELGETYMLKALDHC